jgi:hypothetical protein
MVFKTMHNKAKHIILLSCVKMKRSEPAAAKDMYVSPLFQKMLAYARRQKVDGIFILSAKYGLLELDRIIDPYEKTLNNMKVADIRRWADHVLQQLEAVADLRRDRFTILAGLKYRKYLVGHLDHHTIPMRGMKLGSQLAFLNRQLEAGV